MTQVDDSLEAGREAVRRHAWRDAYELLGSADEDGRLEAEDLENLGEAAWWTGRLEEALALRERAYVAFAEAGSLDGGARFPLSEPRLGTLKGFEEPIDLVPVDWR